MARRMQINARKRRPGPPGGFMAGLLILFGALFLAGVGVLVYSSFAPAPVRGSGAPGNGGNTSSPTTQTAEPTTGAAEPTHRAVDNTSPATQPG